MGKLGGTVLRAAPSSSSLMPRQSGSAPLPSAFSGCPFRIHHLVSFVPRANICWGGGPFEAIAEVLGNLICIKSLGVWNCSPVLFMYI